MGIMRKATKRVASAGIILASAAAAPAAAVAAVGGGAYALNANVNALAAPLSIGALPSVTLPADGGGPYTDSLLSANVLGLAPVRAAVVSTEGKPGLGTVASSASVLEADVAGVVTVSVARSQCSVAGDSASGAATVADLVVAGIAVNTIDAGPNTRISLPVGTVTVNEQRSSGHAGLTVNAVHVTLDAAAVGGDIIIGQSRCSVTTSTRARAAALRRARKAARR